MKFFVLAACIAGALARPDGAGHGHGHDHGHSAAAAAPATGYQEPASGYSAPSGSGYEQPGYDQSSGYEQTGYEQSGYETGYPQDSYAVADEGGFSLSMLILPVMILAGLALLFPSVQTVAVKRKRSAEDGESHKQHNTHNEKTTHIHTTNNQILFPILVFSPLFDDCSLQFNLA